MNITPYTYLTDAMQLVQSITIADEELPRRLSITDLQDVFPAATIDFIDKVGAPPISIEAIGFDHMDLMLAQALIRALSYQYTTDRILRLDPTSLLALEEAWPITCDRVLSLVDDQEELTQSQIAMLQAIADLDDDELTYHYLTHHRARLFGAAEPCGICWDYESIGGHHTDIIWQAGYGNVLTVPSAELKALLALDVVHRFSVIQIGGNGELEIAPPIYEDTLSAACDPWELRLDKSLWAFEKAHLAKSLAA